MNEWAYLKKDYSLIFQMVNFSFLNLPLKFIYLNHLTPLALLFFCTFAFFSFLFFVSPNIKKLIIELEWQMAIAPKAI